MGHSFRGVPHVIKPLASRLEAEASAKLRLERNAERLGEAGRAEEVDRFTEIRLSRSVLKLTAKVRSVEDIESLEEETDFVSLVPLKELRDAQVQLREAIAAHRIWRQQVLVVAVARVAVFKGHAIAVDVAAAGRKDAPPTRRRHLENRRDLEAPTEIEDA